MNGIMCLASVYEYAGWRFEFHRYLGPWPLTVDGNQRKRAGRKFYADITPWLGMTDEERQKYMVEDGGCVPLGADHA